LVVSAHRDEGFAVRCLRQSAAGYVRKSADAEELLAAISKVLAGGRYITSSLAERLAVLLGDADAAVLHELLSKR
jgi:DNA-binding NarL/FixJ family response regulator